MQFTMQTLNKTRTNNKHWTFTIDVKIDEKYNNVKI